MLFIKNLGNTSFSDLLKVCFYVCTGETCVIYFYRLNFVCFLILAVYPFRFLPIFVNLGKSFSQPVRERESFAPFHDPKEMIYILKTEKHCVTLDQQVQIGQDGKRDLSFRYEIGSTTLDVNSGWK